MKNRFLWWVFWGGVVCGQATLISAGSGHSKITHKKSGRRQEPARGSAAAAGMSEQSTTNQGAVSQEVSHWSSLLQVFAVMVAPEYQALSTPWQAALTPPPVPPRTEYAQTQAPMVQAPRATVKPGFSFFDGDELRRRVLKNAAAAFPFPQKLKSAADSGQAGGAGSEEQNPRPVLGVGAGVGSALAELTDGGGAAGDSEAAGDEEECEEDFIPHWVDADGMIHEGPLVEHTPQTAAGVRALTQVLSRFPAIPEEPEQEGSGRSVLACLSILAHQLQETCAGEPDVLTDEDLAYYRHLL